MDGYLKGLPPKVLAWATKLYSGHRMYPENIMQEWEKAVEEALQKSKK